MGYYKDSGGKQLIEKLKNYIGHSNWFISGSCANPNVKFPRDIDIFFFSKVDLETACKNIGTSLVFYETDCAIVYFLKGIDLPIQLISKNFGTISEIFDTFDLNVCKHAITSSGDYIKHPNADKPLHIIKINCKTFNRYFKYTKRSKDGFKNLAPSAIKLIDKYITNTELCMEYYQGELRKTPINKLLFDTVIMEVLFDAVIMESLTSMHEEPISVKKYLKKQAIKHAPELVI